MALRSLNVLDTPPEPEFDDLARLVAAICGTPMALVSLIDTDCQWFKSCVGLDAKETSRDVAFCAHAIRQPDRFVVPDATADERFADNPFVVGEPHVRFYAGMPLATPDGYNLGTLCVVDGSPRTLTPQQYDALRILARQVIAQIELRRQTAELRAREAKFRGTVDRLNEGLFIVDAASKRVVDANAAILALLGYTAAEFLAFTPADLVGRESKEVIARTMREVDERLARHGRCDLGRRNLAPQGRHPGAGGLAGAAPAHRRGRAARGGGERHVRAGGVREPSVRVPGGAGAGERPAEGPGGDRRADQGEQPAGVQRAAGRRVGAGHPPRPPAVRHPPRRGPLQAVQRHLRRPGRGRGAEDRRPHPGGHRPHDGRGGQVRRGGVRLHPARHRLRRGDGAGRAVAAVGWEQRAITVSLGVATLTATTPDIHPLLKEADDALYRSNTTARIRS